MAVILNWSGDAIIRDTVMWDKRAVLGNPGLYIPTDIRAWLSSTNSEVILKTLRNLGLPTVREAGTFDRRAWMIWNYVAGSIQYVTDKSSFGLDDFWLFPEETLVLHKGDCEDTSFLLATLLLASGISEHCVRVVLGSISTPDGSFGHAWVVYQDELGRWCLLESTLDSIPEQLTPADTFIAPASQYRYQPQFCLNGAHVWSMGEAKSQIDYYLKTRGRMQRKEKASRKGPF